MEAMRQTWTDDRMDDLAQHVDAGFSQLRVDMGSMREELRRGIKDQGEELRRDIKDQGRELRKEIKDQSRELRGEIQKLRVQMDARLDGLNAIVAAGQRTMLQICGGLCVALIAAVATLVSTIV